MSVYFIGEAESGPVKVGHTDGDPQDRLKALQTGHPGHLVVLGVVPGSARTERGYHRRLWASHVRGEWFGRAAALELLQELTSLRFRIRRRLDSPFPRGNWHWWRPGDHAYRPPNPAPSLDGRVRRARQEPPKLIPGRPPTVDEWVRWLKLAGDRVRL